MKLALIVVALALVAAAPMDRVNPDCAHVAATRYEIENRAAELKIELRMAEIERSKAKIYAIHWQREGLRWAIMDLRAFWKYACTDA